MFARSFWISISSTIIIGDVGYLSLCTWSRGLFACVSGLMRCYFLPPIMIRIRYHSITTFHTLSLFRLSLSSLRISSFECHHYYVLVTFMIIIIVTSPYHHHWLADCKSFCISPTWALFSSSSHWKHPQVLLLFWRVIREWTRWFNVEKLWSYKS